MERGLMERRLMGSAALETSGSFAAEAGAPKSAGGPVPAPLRPYVAAARRVMPIFAFGVFPVLLTLMALLTEARLHKFTGDFYYAFWPAGHHVLQGASPYVDPSSPLIARSMAFVYPAVAALAMAPLAMLPRVVGDELFTALDIGAVLLTLRVLNVRDWRLYGVVLLWPAVFSGWYTSNVTLLLGLGIALAWRYRDRAAVAGLLVALVVSVKLFLWPLAVWLLATRRYAAFVWAVVGGVVVNAIAWAALGLDELHRYTRLLHALTITEGRRGYSLVALALHHGIDRQTGYAIAIALAGVTLAAAVAIGRRGNHAAALTLAVAASLIATPLLWLHYFALLLVPLAIARPRLRWVWLLPLLTFMYPVVRPASWQVIVALAVACVVVASVVVEPRTRESRMAT